ncbi:MAG: hypothetical protein WAK20_21180 [Candidatus Acidiferrum sp.]
MSQYPVKAPTIRELFHDSVRFWECRRIFYNAVLVGVVLLWLALTWPHFRAMLRWNSLLLLVVLGLIANLCYCAAYFVDMPLSNSSVASVWRQRRWILWLVGTIFATVLANYWIADEIYSFVPQN